jgi:WD40 repeat protein
VAALTGHTSGITSLAFAPDGSTLAGGGSDSKIHFWDLKTEKYLRGVETRSSQFLAWSPSGDTLASSSRSSLPTCLWNAKTGKLLRELPAEAHGQFLLAFSPDGKHLVTAGGSSAIHIWDVATGKETKANSGHSGEIYSLVFSPDGKLLASRSRDQTVRLWDVGKRSQRSVLSFAPENGLREGPSRRSSFAAGLAFSPDGSLITAGAFTNTTGEPKGRFWEVATGKQVGEWGKDIYYYPNAIAFSRDGKTLASSTYDGTRILSVPRGTELQPRQFEPTEERGNNQDLAVAISSSGVMVIGNLLDHLRFQGPTGKSIRQITTSPFGAANAVFSPDGRLLASGGGWPPDPRLKRPVLQLWEVATGKALLRIGTEKEGFYSFTLSPDGRLLATADHPETPVRGPLPAGAKQQEYRVRVWSVFTGKELARFTGHKGAVYCVAFSPDGKTLASGSADANILLWDVSKLDARLPAMKLTARDLDRLWADLLTAEGEAALRAMRDLIAGGDASVKYIGKHIEPVAEPDGKKVQAWLKDLDDSSFKVRTAAFEELARLGDRVEGALRKALADRPSAEAKKQIERLLRAIPDLPTEAQDIRNERALLVLEQVGSKNAQECLERLAGGAASARLTREAKAALQRLQRGEHAKAGR